MTNQQHRTPEIIGSVTIDGKQYRVVRQPDTGLAYKKSYINEPPWSQGSPPMVSNPQISWHLGAFKSRGQISGVTDYGNNTDTRWFRRLLPAPAVNVITLPASVSGPSSIFETLGYIFAVCGRYVFRIDPFTFVVTLSKDFGASVNGVMGLKWDSDIGYVTTDAATGSLWKVTAIIPGGPDTWTQSADTHYYIYPTGEGGAAQWTPLAGTNNALMVDDIQGASDEDTTYNSSATNAQVDILTWDTGASGLPASGAVASVTVNIRARMTATGTANTLPYYLIGTDGVLLSTVRQDPAFVDNTSYQTFSHEFTSNPFTGLPWRASDVLSLFGIQYQHPNTATTIRVTQVYLNVKIAGTAAYRLAAGINRLFKVTKEGLLRNISTGLDPMVESNYADEIQIGNRATIPTGMTALERTVVVGKPEGLYGAGEEGYGIPLIQRVGLHNNNFYGLMTYDPYVIAPHFNGVYRFTPGSAEAIGIELEIANESPIMAGRFGAFAPDGDWLYGFYNVDGDTTYMLAGREKKGSEASFGPLIWDTLLQYAVNTYAAYVSSTGDQTKLWFGYGVNIAWMSLSDLSDSNHKYQLTGSRFMSKINFDDWHNKDFPMIKVSVKNCDANNYWTLNYSIDGGAFANQDINGSVMRTQSNGLNTFFLPILSPIGREIQWRFDYTMNQDASAIVIEYVEEFGRPQPRRMGELILNLYLGDDIHHDNMEIDTRSAIEQLNALEALQKSPIAVNCNFLQQPGTDFTYYWLEGIKVLSVDQNGYNPASFVIEAILQEREYTL